MAYESFYEGGYSALDSEYGRKNKDDFFYGSGGIRTPAGRFSITTDSRTANQIAEVSNKLNMGIKNIEVSTLTPEVFESIPKQHLKEIDRISKLTGAEMTVHGLLVEASGISQQGGFSEVQRESTEKQMLLNVEKAAEISPGGVITFHATVGVPEAEETVLVKDEQGRLVPKKRSVMFIDPRTGRMRAEKDITERYFPTEGKKFTGEPQKFDPETEIQRVNEEGWRGALRELNFSVVRGNEQISKEGEGILDNDAIKKIERGEMSLDKFQGPERKVAEREYYGHRQGEQFLRSGYREMRELFDLAYKKAKETAEKKGGDKHDLQELQGFMKDVEKNFDKIDENNDKYDPNTFADIVRKGTDVLGKVHSPDFFVPLNDFVLDKSSTTFGDVAWQAYNKLHDKAPVISIENPPAGGGLSKAEDMRKLIEQSRDKFVENAKKSGYSESEARKASEKMIGATWDVGHINMLRKYGYTDKELIAETKKIAPFVKHVHLSDNFGLDHTELPMGMGNVPLKEHLEVLKKAGFEGKQVIEAFNWWQHFKTPPFGETLEAMGSPLYSMKMSPYWNQIRSVYGNYFSGYGPILPEQHFSLYGGGFSALPQELGGQVPGKQSRFSGTPTE